MTKTTMLEPPEYPPRSSADDCISIPPQLCDDHKSLLIKLPPPRVVEETSKISEDEETSKTEDDASLQQPQSVEKTNPPLRRRESIDPPEVLSPCDAVDMNDSVTAPPSVGSIAKTTEEMGALALVPYEYSISPDPATQENEHALVVHEPNKKHRRSSRELVPANEQQLVAQPDYPMRKGFDHCFITVPTKERLSALFATLRRNADRKVIVVFGTWESAKFHSLLFRQLELFSVYEMHESMEDVDVVHSHNKFLYNYPGVLFASDIALREFDIPPNVDYILQYEPPMDPTEYIYRFSTAKLFETSCHKALLFLSPEGKEMNFLRYFQHAGVEVSELQARKVSEFQEKVQKMVLKHTELNEAAWKAFRSYVVAFEGHPHRDVWDKRDIDEESVRKSFAMPHYPSYVVSQHKEDKIVKELITKEVKATEKVEKQHHHKEVKEESKEEKSHQHASWMRGKERTWRSGQNKSWMNKEKSWKHAHVNTKFASSG